MRTILYAIFDTENKTKVFTSANLYRIHEKMETLGNSEKYEIRYKWASF